MLDSDGKFVSPSMNPESRICNLETCILNRRKTMNWKSHWKGDINALNAQLKLEGFLTPHQWTGRPGAAYLDYIHAHDEVVCVLSGAADVKVGKETAKIGVGDRVDVPANTYHSITVTSAEPLVVLTGMQHG
jgi:hypothetical protein